MIPYEQSVRPEPVEGQVLDVSPFLKGNTGGLRRGTKFCAQKRSGGFETRPKSMV